MNWSRYWNRVPTPEEVAKRDLQDAKRMLLREHAYAEHHAGNVVVLRKRIDRLTKYLATPQDAQKKLHRIA